MNEKKRLRLENKIFREFLENQNREIERLLHSVSNLEYNEKPYCGLIDMVDIPGRDFKMSKYQITQEQYENVMREKPSHFKGHNLPVDSVSWYDATEFCKKLTNINTDGITFRLPTEEEWEYCAKGGENYKYAGSDNIDEVAWYYNNSENKTHPVGLKKPNGFGLFDMSGNVWEWCSNILEKDYRMLRGGSFNDGGYGARVDYRYSLNPNYANGLYGFRVVSGSH